MNRKRLGKTLIIVYAAFYLYVLFVFWSPWYTSVEARYARDNLNYLTTKLSEKGVLAEPIKTDGNDFFHWPYDRSVKKLYILSSEWCSAYIQHLDDKGVLKDSDYNPYDALSRLKYDSLIPEVNTVYECIMMETAMTNSEMDYTGGILNAWEHKQEEVHQKAEKAIATMEEQKVMCGTILGITTVPILVFGVYMVASNFIFAPKNHNNNMQI